MDKISNVYLVYYVVRQETPTEESELYYKGAK